MLKAKKYLIQILIKWKKCDIAYLNNLIRCQR